MLISPLRARMIEDMSVRKFTQKTQSDYIRHVKSFSTFRAPIAVSRPHCIAIVETLKAVETLAPSLCAGPNSHRYLLMTQQTSAPSLSSLRP